MGRPKGSVNIFPIVRETKFGAMGRYHLHELQHFIGMHDRVRDGKAPSIEWPRNAAGFILFMEEVGVRPWWMKKPSIGRRDHKRGYVRGNIQWEEFVVNSVKRTGTRFARARGYVAPIDRSVAFKRGTESHRRWWRKEIKRRWRSQKFRSKHAAGIKAAWAAGKFNNRRRP